MINIHYFFQYKYYHILIIYYQFYNTYFISITFVIANELILLGIFINVPYIPFKLKDKSQSNLSVNSLQSGSENTGLPT